MPDLSSALTPSVAPDKSAPDDRQNISADASSFGGAIAQGLEKAGAGAEQASAHFFDTSKFFGQVAADNASNDYQDFATKLLHGDPNKTVPGPDGTPQPDTGYLGLRGRDALDRRPDVTKALDDQLNSVRETLKSPEQQLQFDNFSRHYRAAVEEKVGAHADDQAKTWYQSVNVASSKLALDQISLNADNPKAYLAGEADLVHAYVKTAQLAGAQPGDPQYQEAVASARRDALKARLDAVAVKNPSQALGILDQPENKAIAGQFYDNMSASYRGRANQQRGYDVADQAIKRSYDATPALNPATLTNAGAPYGISGSYLMRVHQMEGNGVSSTGAKGPFGFLDSTAKQYGLQNPFDVAAAAEATAKKAADDKVTLTASLGRPPTDAELYLAHNQGAGGAHSLLTHPNAPAGSLIPAYKIAANGGDPNAPAIAFTSMMTNKFNQAPISATQSRKAQVIGDIQAIPPDQIDPDVREHATRHAEQQFAAQAVAEETDAKSRKAASDQVYGGFTSRIIRGDTNGIIGEIAAATVSPTNPNGIPAADASNLWKMATERGGVDDPLLNGPAYSDALKRMVSSPNDPAHISDLRDLVQMKVDGTLTKKGLDELSTTLDKLKKQPDQAGIEKSRSAQLDYYKSQFSIDQEMTLPGMKPYKSQKGLDKFNHDFVPAFNGAYQKWIEKGKDPYEFLNDKKQLDAIMDQVYPPAQRAADALSAEGGGPNDKIAPPPPAGVEPKTWTKLIASPPHRPDGTALDPGKWGAAINRLRDHPTPDYIAAFNEKLAPSGITAEDILKAVPPKGYVPPAPPKAVAAQPEGPGILSTALSNVIHYGKTGRAPATGDEGAEIVPGEALSDHGGPLDRLVRDNAVKPEQRSDNTLGAPATVGIRG